MARDNPDYDGFPFDDGAFFNIPANDCGEFVRLTAVNLDIDFGAILKRKKELQNYLDCGTIPLLGTADYNP